MNKIPVISIDRGIPVPEMAAQGLPLGSLKVGESILFPLEHRSKVAIQASRLKKSTAMRFTVRKESETNARIWRVE